MNLGRRPEGPDDPEESWFRTGRGATPPAASPGRLLSRPDRYRVRLRRQHLHQRRLHELAHRQVRQAWRLGEVVGLTRRRRRQHGEQNPGQFNTPHNIAVDRQNNVYVADRNNRRIQVFDADGTFQRFIFLNATYDKNASPGAWQH